MSRINNAYTYTRIELVKVNNRTIDLKSMNTSVCPEGGTTDLNLFALFICLNI